MFNPRKLSALVILGLVTGTLPPVQARAPRTTQIQVTTTIADLGGDHELRVQSDRKGAYATKVVNRVTQVTSVIDQYLTGSAWSLTTYYTVKGNYTASDRTVFFDLRERAATGSFATPPIGTDGDGAPVEYGQVTSHLIAKCSLVNVDMLKIPLGWTASCPGSFRFRAPDGQWYRLSFQPDNYSEVDRLNVTCTAADSAGCKVWTIASGGTAVTGTDPNPKSLNNLLLIDSGGAVIAEGGDYYLSFAITVAR
jgi:hypothetical protein